MYQGLPPKVQAMLAATADDANTRACTTLKNAALATLIVPAGVVFILGLVLLITSWRAKGEGHPQSFEIMLAIGIILVVMGAVTLGAGTPFIIKLADLKCSQ
jgi:hypothetical protein